MTLQALNDNPDTWGDVLNTSAIELLEDAIAGEASVILLSAANYTMDTTAGGDAPSNNDHYRKMAVDITGTPGGATNVIVPDLTGLYCAMDNTTGGDIITLKTAAGSGVALTAGVPIWCYCDGTDVLDIQVKTAGNAATATLAADSTLLGGVAASAYATLAAAQTWTQGQVTQRSLITDDLAGTLTANLATSNTFFHEMTGGENLATPINATNGAQFSLVLEQGSGAPHVLTFQANTFLWEGGVAPTLSTGVGDIDYLAFEYVTNAAVGNRWIGSILKDVS
jgi:hypothetical protein